MLTFNLKKQWFDKIKNGEKTHEYREVKDYWTKIILKDWYGVDPKRTYYAELSSIFLKRCKNEVIYPFVEHGGEYTLDEQGIICFMNGMVSEEIKPRIYAKAKSIHICDGNETDLKISLPVYDIEFEVIE